jgi:mannose-6-phosphate isomerase-like protein (cupin superfamily)
MTDLSSRNFEGLEAFAFEPRKVEKPWGYELIWAHAEDLYVGKILFVKAGNALSLQFHNLKDETWYFLSGRAEVEMGMAGDATPNKEIVGPGAGFRMNPGTIHRVTALEDTTILEASTPHLDDIVRLEDLYGRIES